MNTVKVFIDFILSNQKEIVEQTIEHIGLTVVALAIAVFIGLPVVLVIRSLQHLY